MNWSPPSKAVKPLAPHPLASPHRHHRNHYWAPPPLQTFPKALLQLDRPLKHDHCAEMQSTKAVNLWSQVLFGNVAMNVDAAANSSCKICYIFIPFFNFFIFFVICMEKLIV